MLSSTVLVLTPVQDALQSFDSLFASEPNKQIFWHSPLHLMERYRRIFVNEA